MSDPIDFTEARRRIEAARTKRSSERQGRLDRCACPMSELFAFAFACSPFMAANLWYAAARKANQS